MSTHKKILLENHYRNQISIGDELRDIGNILIQQLLSNNFRKELSIKESEELLDTAINNLIEGDLLVSTTIVDIKNRTNLSNFIIDGALNEIREE